jgi:hypothetical protein
LILCSAKALTAASPDGLNFGPDLCGELVVYILLEKRGHFPSRKTSCMEISLHGELSGDRRPDAKDGWSRSATPGPP